MPKNSEPYTEALKALLSSHTVLAVGLDPIKGSVSVMIRTDKGEQRKTVPLKPEHKMYFDMIKNLVGSYL